MGNYMSGSAKLALYLFGTVLGLFLLLQLVRTVLHLMAFLVPIVAIAGVAVLVFAVVNRKGIGPGRRRILP